MSSLMTRSILPLTWESQGSVEAKEFELSKNSIEYRNVLPYLSGSALRNLTHIVRVQNPYLYGRYLLRKNEYKKISSTYLEKTLLHVTSSSNVQSIIKNNLNWRLVKRGRFGKGVSFSPDAEYANKECSKNTGNNRAVLICKVLVNKSHSAWYTCKIPKLGYDTTTDKRNKVFVKYYDDEFYPEYIAYYKNIVTTSTQLRYNAYDTDSDSDDYYCDSDSDSD